MRTSTISLAATGLALALPMVANAATFRANLIELNNSGVSGVVRFNVDEVNQRLNVMARVSGLAPSQLHLNHIHGRFDGGYVEGGTNTPMNSVLPTEAVDAIANGGDGDGYVEVLEAASAYGDILLSLEPALALPSADPSMVHTGPSADENGDLNYDLSFDLTDNSIFFSPVLGTNYTAADIFPLGLREYIIHGDYVPAGIIDPDAGAGYAATLPVAGAELSAVPLPAGGLLLLSGLAGLGLARGRRRSA